MRTALRAGVAAGIVLLALAGCRTRPPQQPSVTGPGGNAAWPEQRAALEKLERYSLSGRIAVAANGQGFSPPLQPGTYSFWAQQTDDFTEYVLRFVVDIPAPASAALLGAPLLMPRRRRPDCPAMGLIRPSSDR